MLSLKAIMATPTLILGNKAYSSWSLRGWLALTAVGCDFSEVVIPLRQSDTRTRILDHSPTGKVPALVLADLVISESLAICEWAAETFPEAGLWPTDPKARAMARSAASEMHAGFAALRKAVPMTVLGKHPGFTPDAEVAADIRRISELWQASRERFGSDGPWLFGSYSVADIMFAPVAIRFATAGVELDPVSAAWRDTMLNRPDMQRWIREGRAEVWRLPEIDTEFSADWK